VGGAARLNDDHRAQIDTKVVLILANHLGDLDVLKEVIALAEQSARLKIRAPDRRSNSIQPRHTR